MSSTTSSALARPRARSTRPRSSSRRSPAASCRRSARRRSTSTASTSSATRPWSAASSRCAWRSPPWTTRCRSCGLRDRYEAHHRVTITDDALKAAAELSDRYIQDRHLPDKAIDLIDEAASRLRIKSMSAPPRYRELEDEIERVRKEKEASIENQEFEKAASLRDKERKLTQKKRELEEQWRSSENQEEQPQVGEEEIADIVSMWTGIPVFKLTEAESARLVRMEEELHKRVVGQEEAIVAVSKSIRRARAGIKDPKRPTGSFIFLGPSGVGKTELARTLAEFLFGDEDAMIQIDMSEYMEKHSVSRLVGSPPGYIGYD